MVGISSDQDYSEAAAPNPKIKNSECGELEIASKDS